MKPSDNAALRRLLQDASRIARAMDETVIAAGDATSYAHYGHELQMLVEEIGVLRAPKRVLEPVRGWPVWNRADLAGCHEPEAAAHEARADHRYQLRCDDGPNTARLESITTTAAVVPGAPFTDRVGRP